MQPLQNLNLEQTIAGMPLTFNPDAAGDLTADIQFNVSGNEPGIYYLHIANGRCTFQTGEATDPALTISTPSDIWLQISRKELDGQAALLSGLYSAQGDLSLMLQMDALFGGEMRIETSGQRPGGPLPLSGMAWMVLGFAPWITFWIMFDIPGISMLVKAGLPLLMTALLVGYRRVFNQPDPLSWGGLAFFSLAFVLSATGDIGFAVWGSVVSGTVLAGLWLATLLLGKMPLSAHYSKWAYVPALWRNSLFLHANAVISLMWGWQFILASMVGAAAIVWPEWQWPLTVLRYGLLIPALVFTVYYKNQAMSLRVDDQARNQVKFGAGLGLSAVSGLLLAATMPNFDVGLLGWVALVPVLATLNSLPGKQRHLLVLPFGLIWSIAVHNWYPNIFPPALGYFLIIAVGVLYGSVLNWGMTLQDRLYGAWKLLAVPTVWAVFEFIKFIAPVVNEWWFVLLAKSQWRFPPALQLLGVGGFPALSFVVMLANVAVAFLILDLRFTGKTPALGVSRQASLAALGGVLLLVGWGWLTVFTAPTGTPFTVTAITDMSGADTEILSLGGELFQAGVEGPYADTAAMSQALFDVNADLTRQAAAQSQPDFVVWGENEFADADDPQFMGQVAALAAETGAYLMVDTVWRRDDQMHDTALLMAPNAVEAGRWAKTHLFSSETDYGFSPGPATFAVIETPFGNVGGGVCYDYHYLDVVRQLALNGAQLILMPTDDNFNGTPWFPPFHASDAVFRAVEHRLAFATGTINGKSVVVDPYGNLQAEGAVNQRSAVSGTLFVTPVRTFYTVWGDWFGWLTVITLLGLIALSMSQAQREDSAESRLAP